MTRALARTVRLACLGLLIPLVLSLVVYFGFASTYTTGVFSDEGFRVQYEEGIYKYRVLGRLGLLGFKSLIEDAGLPALAPRALLLLDRNGSPVFYTAYFLDNAFFLCLACGVLVLLFDRRCPPDALWIADLAVLLLALLMAITQYVVVPYDTMSYFFLCLAFVLIFARTSLMNTVLLGLVVVLGALTRETAALILAFYFAVHHRSLLARPFRRSAAQATLLFLIVCFLATYAGLRLALGPGEAVFQDVQLLANLVNPFGLAGLLFAVAATAVLLLSSPGRRESVVFLLASLPYALFILATARLWEIRLWVPVLLSIVVLKVCLSGEGDQKTKMS